MTRLWKGFSHGRLGMLSLVVVAVSLQAGLTPAAERLQTVATPEVGELQERVAELEAEIASLRSHYDERLAELERRMGEAGAGTAAEQTAEASDLSQEERAALEAELAGVLGEGEPPTPEPSSPQPSQRQFTGRSRRLNALNPEISVTGDIVGSAADRSGDPNANQFRFDEFELALQAPLDPFSLGKAFITQEGGEFGVEEAYIDYASLPAGLGLKIGQFRNEWGKLNRWHQHALPQVERPAVHDAIFGEEGLSGLGVSLSWLPRPFLGSYNEFWLEVTNDENDVAFSGRGFDDPIFLLHETNYWDLSPATYLEVGVSAATGTNDELGQFRSQVYGVDWNLNWVPPERSLYEGLEIRGEAMFRRRELDGGQEDIAGVYTYGTFKLGQRWNIGLRGDWSEIPGAPGQSLWGVSPYFEWWQSEWTQWRFQYTYNSKRLDQPDEDENKLFFQVVWSLGPHKHERY